MVFHENRMPAAILMKYQTFFFLKTGKDVAKFVVCCSRDWCIKG